jgi:TyrR family helix-turn-helix protein
MQNVMMLAKRLASVNTTVLITGESGVGKGLIAKTLHEEGNRWKEPFVTVNCGAIPENLIESELFGYVAGAFTGSRSGGKKGLFEAAQNGTIFLDEISELPLNLQVKLLQVIQERQITPVGSTEAIPIDVRIISATNRDLETLVKEGKFREDLYYRLNVVPLNVPPLRERHEDILPLIQLNLAKCNRNLHENKRISSDALSILIKYPWPGNTRELQNIVERLLITTSHDVISSEDIFEFIKQAAEENTSISVDLSLAAAMEKAEKEILEQALENYKSTRAIAKVLQVSQPTIVRKLNKYGLVK